MDEQQVRALVRQAIAKHLTGGALAPVAAPVPGQHSHAVQHVAPSDHVVDISHARFHLVRAAGEVECLIEPAVACNHCGFCQTYGH